MNKKLIVSIILGLAVVIFGIAAVNFYSGGGDSSGEVQDETSDQEREEVESDEQNFLVLGVDGRESSSGRTDTMMVVNADPAGEQVTLMSIPRDTRVKLKGSYERINAAYVYGGTDMAVNAVENLLDIEIDHYAIVDFRAFIEVVDLLGGVKVDVPQRMYYPAEGIDLQPGEQLLNGEDALAFARYRYTEGGDLDRAAHQQQILKALWEKTFRLGNITKIPEFVDIAQEYVKTDLSKTEMAAMAAKARHFKGQGLVTKTLPGEVEKVDGLWYYLTDHEEAETSARPFRKDI